jgi:hypothetical protein
VTGWQRAERWLALLSFVASVAAFLGWVGAVATGSGWWSGLVVLLVAIGPACYAYVTLPGAIPHVAGLFTLIAVGLAGMTVVRRYEMPPVGR